MGVLSKRFLGSSQIFVGKWEVSKLIIFWGASVVTGAAFRFQKILVELSNDKKGLERTLRNLLKPARSKTAGE